MKFPTLAALLLAACNTGKTSEIAALDGDPDAGAVIYEDNCATCHAADGSGGTGPDLTGESEGPEEVIDVVYGGEDEMPAFSGSLSDQDIADVAAFVVEVLQGG